MSDLASNAAALSAGYVRVQVDRGSGSASNPRYSSRYERPTTGAPGQAGGLTTAEGQSNVDQATADTAALAALNNARGHRYGFGSSTNSGHTRDLS